MIIGQEKRTSNYTLQPDENPIDDSHLPASFYRFNSKTGNDIVNEEQAMFQCGTKFPIYMIGNMLDIQTKCVTLKFSSHSVYNSRSIYYQFSLILVISSYLNIKSIC